MEKDNILEQEITEKKKATTKKKVASSSKDDSKSTTKKVAAKDGEKKPTTKKATAKADDKKATTKKTTAKKATSTKSTAAKKTTTKSTAAKKPTTKKVEPKEDLAILLNKKVVVDDITEENVLENAELDKVVNKTESEEKAPENKIFDLPKKNVDSLKTSTPIDAQEIDHVAILKKKMEAQKKLKENILEETQPSKPIIKFDVESNVDYINDEIQQKNDQLTNELESLKLENEKLKSEMSNEVESLKQENEKLKNEKFDEVETLKQENEKLKNAMTNEVESLKQENEKLKNEMSNEVENLKQENEKLKNVNSDEVKTLKQENEKLKTAMSGEVETLKSENEKLKSEISGLMANINDKEEKLIILTNSIVNKSSENELAKEIELLRKENKELQEQIETIKVTTPEEDPVEVLETLVEQKEDLQKDDSQALAFEVIDKGEISFRIKLLNERIAEKDNQIKLVEEELNNLSEKDIVAEGFASEIKTIRKIRKESISLANSDLNELAKLVKSSEAKLIEKQKAYAEKCKEIKDFDENMKSKQLSYTEKEAELNARSILFATKDSLFVEIESHEENYKKLLNRYKVRLEKAEASLEKLNNAESDLLNRYLSQLREDKSNSNEDYQMQLMERNALYEELNKLQKEMETTFVEEEKLSFEQFDINALKSDLAKYAGKLALIAEKYAEREKIEKVLLKNEQNIKDYYDAFKNRETVLFNINENNLRIKSLEVKLSQEENDVKREILKGRIDSINILVADDKEKANYYNNIIEKSRDDEKVAFYIKLINSMIELKDKEKEYTFKVENIKANIAKLEAE